MEKELRNALLTLWSGFTQYVIKGVPNYTDNDFNINNFIKWLKVQQDAVETEFDQPNNPKLYAIKKP